jgi:glyoxylase-like metal-dependent hydrolase (beta-lactamase superfamily II)
VSPAADERLAAHDVGLVRADNPSPFTLDGTNTWLVGRDPCWIVDPGPALDAHLDAVADEARRRGGAGGIAVTHDHPDHVEGVAGLRARLGDPPLAAARGTVDRALADGDRFGPLVAHAIPGHAPDHLAYVSGGVAFTGDAVLGEGSVFLVADLAPYLDALRRLRALGLALLCPGHGPLITDPAAKLDAYVEHRLDRERRLLEALAEGGRTVDELLDAAWDDAPDVLRPAAAVTLAAHLDKLEDEGRLPYGVERPEIPAALRAP